MPKFLFCEVEESGGAQLIDHFFGGRNNDRHEFFRGRYQRQQYGYRQQREKVFRGRGFRGNRFHRGGGYGVHNVRESRRNPYVWESEKKSCVLLNDNVNETSGSEIIPKEPMFNDRQLLGDSHFYRFACHYLGFKSREIDGEKRVGLCIGGQTIQELNQNIQESSLVLHENILLFIGTTDILQKSSIANMQTDMEGLLLKLKERVKCVQVLTLPPILKVPHEIAKINEFNDFLRKLKTTEKDFEIRVIDIFSFFSREENDVLFSKHDMIHFNSKGNAVLWCILKESCFDVAVSSGRGAQM